MRASKGTVEKARVLRRELTFPEILLWQLLRRGGLTGLRFRRQHPVGPYVLDFFCTELALAVEVDGAAHDHPDRVARDARRDLWLAGQGVSVLRIPARDLLTEEGRQSVLATIAARAPSTAVPAVPLPAMQGRTSAPPTEAYSSPACGGDHAKRGGGGATGVESAIPVPKLGHRLRRPINRRQADRLGR